ncbi:inositol 1,4,5-triphosphate receptor associated 2-like isoform X2 [Bombus pyrosoma]|uniref:inositol 1,4,5-triphosphate receptor associated 2-like isoform X2 n=1 Tax=Bombus pyrosoma TaxID=396416 RepID=UPI001CB8D837|nr:inositol 1,4,5-triphosphate receptor associated 2-like isoform X2 [Bombus pyrosoma]
MDESTSDNEKQPRSQEVDADQKQRTSIKATNYMTSNDTDLSKIPKRKLSVFYRSFDVIAQVDQEKEKQTLDFRRTSSSPSVQIERTREDVDSKNGQIDQERHFVDDYRSLNENGKFLSCSSPSRLGEKPSSNNGQVSKAGSLSPIGFKLPQVLEDTIVDNYATITETSIGKHYKLNNNGNYEYKVADESAVINSRQTNSSPDLTNTIRSFAKEKVGNAETNSSANGTAEPQHGNSPQTRSACSRAITCTDLVKIKDSEYPRSFVNASGARRLGKYTSVDAEMSSHEDSSMGSDSEDDSIERTVHATICTRNETKNERSRSKSNSPLSQTLSFISMGEPSRKLNLREIHDQKVAEDVEELCPERVERQKLFAARRSLSEGDCERYHRTKRRCRCVKEEESLDEEQEKFPAFPSFNDTRLQIMGLSCSNDIDSVYRENIPENELERKYIAFSIGLSTDRITLHRRMALSLRQRDQSERNFMNEIQKMQEDINGLCPLCTDQESIDKIENVRHQLDMITRSAHRVSCAAETLGAVYQEHRISRAIFIGDKYLQLLRSRCENLAADIADVKQILLKNNIMIEETTGEMGDDLPKLRYRNGLPCNNRTMMTRRRASIATISRPLSTQDIKEIPRQRNSVSGRVNLRRPSLCFETQRWENEKLNRTDTNSVVELREIFEHTEPRRNSIEENNNLLRNDQSNNISSMNCNIASNTRDKDRSIIKQNSFLESSVTKTVEKQIKSCIQTTEPLRITRNIETWRSILWFIFIFFLGFYAKQITSTFVT